LDKYQNILMKERVTLHFGVEWAYYIQKFIWYLTENMLCLL
jgi:hypothetical protein